METVHTSSGTPQMGSGKPMGDVTGGHHSLFILGLALCSALSSSQVCAVEANPTDDARYYHANQGGKQEGEKEGNVNPDSSDLYHRMKKEALNLLDQFQSDLSRRYAWYTPTPNQSQKAFFEQLGQFLKGKFPTGDDSVIQGMKDDMERARGLKDRFQQLDDLKIAKIKERIEQFKELSNEDKEYYKRACDRLKLEFNETTNYCSKDHLLQWKKIEKEMEIKYEMEMEIKCIREVRNNLVNYKIEVMSSRLDREIEQLSENARLYYRQSFADNLEIFRNTNRTNDDWQPNWNQLESNWNQLESRFKEMLKKKDTVDRMSSRLDGKIKHLSEDDRLYYRQSFADNLEKFCNTNRTNDDWEPNWNQLESSFEEMLKKNSQNSQPRQQGIRINRNKMLPYRVRYINLWEQEDLR